MSYCISDNEYCLCVSPCGTKASLCLLKLCYRYGMWYCPSELQSASSSLIESCKICDTRRTQTAHCNESFLGESESSQTGSMGSLQMQTSGVNFMATPGHFLQINFLQQILSQHLTIKMFALIEYLNKQGKFTLQNFYSQT